MITPKFSSLKTIKVYFSLMFHVHCSYIESSGSNYPYPRNEVDKAATISGTFLVTFT